MIHDLLIVVELVGIKVPAKGTPIYLIQTIKAGVQKMTTTARNLFGQIASCRTIGVQRLRQSLLNFLFTL